MNTFSHVPPGFRFHPTDEELVDYYLRKKVGARKIDVDVIKDVDLYKIEPWDLQEKCKLGEEEQNEWYFFSHKDKKYPTGSRTNRATTAGFWKATGRDKPIYLKNNLVGMRKTLVFYKGRAPNGQKSDWIMHEYRLETNENAAPQEEGWVVCRMFKKRVTVIRRPSEPESPCSWYDEHVSFMPVLDSPQKMPPHASDHMAYNMHHRFYSCKPEIELQYYNNMPHDPLFLQLPQQENPKLPTSINQANATSSIVLEEPFQAGHQQPQIISFYNNSAGSTDQSVEQVTDWRVLDKFVASQLSQDDASKEQNYGSTSAHVFQVSDRQEVVAADYASTSNSSGAGVQVDLWK